MCRVSSLVFRLILVVTGILTVSASAQIPASPPKDPDSDPQPPRCIAEADISITASPKEIKPGQSSIVSWSVNLPNACASVRVRLNSQDVPRNGSRTVQPLQWTTYLLTISQTQGGAFAQRSAQTRITVKYPESVVIDPSTPNPIQVLTGALQSGGVKIELCNVDLDLTGKSFAIENDTSLVASEACARSSLNPGPRIFITDHRTLSKPLFEVRGDRVRISGFRLEGPSPEAIYQSDDRLERAIHIAPYDGVDVPQPDGSVICVPVPISSVEISNMEIYHWSGSAIDVSDSSKCGPRGRMENTRVEAVHIFDNFIHNNRHGDGNGYGVAVNSGAYALIERNVFDLNRHAVKGGSREGNDFSGYTLRENLILEGGGRHCSNHWFWPFCWQTHQVDMHGDKDAWRYGGDHCCGTAGETIIIERNTILYDKGHAIKIRGNPVDKAVADSNVFQDDDEDHAIAQNGEPTVINNVTNPIIKTNNVFGAKPMDHLGTCDFDADGKPDKFMATGVTWWAQSGATGQWRYLNTMPEVLSKLQLGDFDNDGKCDVGLGPANPAIPPQKYSKSGTGHWVPVIAGPVSSRTQY